jgi:hypothetical protein
MFVVCPFGDGLYMFARCFFVRLVTVVHVTRR